MIIGLCGKAGSGKDTVADILVRDFGFIKVALADPLKRICKEVFSFSDEQLWGPSDKRNEPDFRYCRTPHQQGYDPVDGHPTTMDAEYLTPRYALQQLGTEWGRNCYPDVWVDYAMRIAKRLLVPGAPLFYTAKEGMRVRYVSDPEVKGVVISDVRFLNEVEGLKRLGARVTRIYRPTQGLKGQASQHASETEQDSIPDELFDFILNNTGALEDLYELTRAMQSKFSIEARDNAFADMLTGIDHGADPDKSAIVTVRKGVVTEVQVMDSTSITDSTPVEVLPEGATPASPHLRAMLEKRKEDIEKGKLLPYDESQSNVPPFKRRR